MRRRVPRPSSRDRPAHRRTAVSRPHPPTIILHNARKVKRRRPRQSNVRLCFSALSPPWFLRRAATPSRRIERSCPNTEKYSPADRPVSQPEPPRRASIRIIEIKKKILFTIVNYFRRTKTQNSNLLRKIVFCTNCNKIIGYHKLVPKSHAEIVVGGGQKSDFDVERNAAETHRRHSEHGGTVHR